MFAHKQLVFARTYSANNYTNELYDPNDTGLSVFAGANNCNFTMTLYREAQVLAIYGACRRLHFSLAVEGQNWLNMEINGNKLISEKANFL